MWQSFRIASELHVTDGEELMDKKQVRNADSLLSRRNRSIDFEAHASYADEDGRGRMTVFRNVKPFSALCAWKLDLKRLHPPKRAAFSVFRPSVSYISRAT